MKYQVEIGTDQSEKKIGGEGGIKTGEFFVVSTVAYWVIVHSVLPEGCGIVLKRYSSMKELRTYNSRSVTVLFCRKLTPTPRHF